MSHPTHSTHCFGKLPIAGDFIRYRLDSDESRAFAGWMERGHSLVEGLRRSNSEPGVNGGRRYRFAFDDGQGHKMLIGLLRESHDRGMLRRFPFALFASVDASVYRSRPALLASPPRAAWRGMEAEIASVTDSADVDTLFRRLDAFMPDLPEADKRSAADLDQWLGQTRNGDFWGGLFPGGSPERRVLLLDVLVRALTPHKKKRPEEMPVAVKLPLQGSADDVARQCAFWIELLAGMVKFSRQAPNLFLESPEDQAPPRSLHLILQRADEKNFAALMTRQYESEYVDDLTGDVRLGSPVLPAAGNRLLVDDGTALSELVRFKWLG